jgi:cold shock CspA family protein
VLTACTPLLLIFLFHFRSKTLEAQRLTGIIRSWKPQQMYGFVFSPEADVDFFLHDSNLDTRNRPQVLVGHIIEFSPTQSEKGFKAYDAIFVDAERAATTRGK